MKFNPTQSLKELIDSREEFRTRGKDYTKLMIADDYYYVPKNFFLAEDLPIGYGITTRSFGKHGGDRLIRESGGISLYYRKQQIAYYDLRTKTLTLRSAGADAVKPGAVREVGSGGRIRNVLLSYRDGFNPAPYTDTGYGARKDDPEESYPGCFLGNIYTDFEGWWLGRWYSKAMHPYPLILRDGQIISRVNTDEMIGSALRTMKMDTFAPAARIVAHILPRIVPDFEFTEELDAQFRVKAMDLKLKGKGFNWGGRFRINGHTFSDIEPINPLGGY